MQGPLAASSLYLTHLVQSVSMRKMHLFTLLVTLLRLPNTFHEWMVIEPYLTG
jgi:hypothetical protein